MLSLSTAPPKESGRATPAFFLFFFCQSCTDASRWALLEQLREAHSWRRRRPAQDLPPSRKVFTSQKVSHQHFASCLEPPNNQRKMSDSSKLPRQHGSSGSVNDHHCYPCKESITRFGRWRRASVWGGWILTTRFQFVQAWQAAHSFCSR